jgi:cytochrome c-type biogenesis protein
MTDTIFGIVMDANVLMAAGVAFAAGLVGFASPCVIPLVPGYLSYMTGLSGEDLAHAGLRARSRVLIGSVLFVVGFAVPFVMLGFAAGLVNFLFRSTGARIAMGSIVALLGVLMIVGRLTREWRVSDRAPTGSITGAPVLGFVFGVGWTPCLGPAAGAILTMSAGVTQGVSIRGAFLGFVYALGLGLPFVIFGLMFRRLSGALAVLRRNAVTMQRIGGGMLVAVGLALITGLWDRFIFVLRPLIDGFAPPI